MFCRKCGKPNPDDSRFCEGCGKSFVDTGDHASGNTGRFTSDQDPFLGQTIAGTFRLDSVLGRGGMGVVYLATNLRINAQMALKVLALNLAHDPDLVRRFEAEASTQARIRHPNIVAVHDFICEGGINAIVMEYVPGITLEEVIHRQTGPMPIERIMRIMLPVMEAVALAHAEGIIHRDIKPSNILVAQLGTQEVPKVMDFGIAKVLTEGGQFTATSSKMGTLWYMSPEQCASAKNVDVRSDIYSLGVTLFEMATGRVPFSSDSDLDLMLAHRDTPPPLPSSIYPGVPPTLERVILRSLEKDPGRRYQDVTAFARELRTCTPSQGVVAKPSPPAPATAPAQIQQPPARPQQPPARPQQPPSTPVHLRKPASPAPNAPSPRVPPPAPAASPLPKAPTYTPTGNARGLNKEVVIMGILAAVLVLILVSVATKVATKKEPEDDSLASALALSKEETGRDEPPPPPPSPALDTPGTAETLAPHRFEIGVPACDDYLKKYIACIDDKIPKSARATMERGLDTMKEAWQKAAETKAGRAGLADACKMALDAAKKSMGAFGCEW